MKSLKKQIAKKIVALALAVLVNTGVISSLATVQAADDHIEIGEYVYSISEQAIVAYTGNDAAVEIPATLTKDGTIYEVRGIGDNAFVGTQLTTMLTDVTIPEGIETIGANAFAFNSLKTVTLPSTITTIGDSAFATNHITDLNIPANALLTKIGDHAFKTNRLNGTLPLAEYTTLTGIGTEAFAANALENVTFPASLETIADSAFANNRMTEVELPSGLTTLGNHVFDNNNRYVIIKGDSPALKTDVTEGSFGSVYQPTSIFVKGIEDSTNTEVLTTTRYDFDPFTDRPKDQLLYVGNTINYPVPRIQKYIAGNITATLDGSNTSDNPFVVHYKLSDKNPVISGLNAISVGLNEPVDLRQGVTAVDAEGNDITSSIKISVDTIDTSVQKEHKITYTVTDAAGNTTTAVRTVLVGIDPLDLEVGKGWVYRDFNYDNDRVVGFSDSGAEKIRTNKELALPAFNPRDPKRQPITKVANYAFQGKNIVSVLFPESIQTVGYAAFKDNSLVSLTLPDNIKEIESEAFRDNKIVDLQLPNQITKINSSTFANNNIGNVQIPDSVKTIDSYAFDHNKIASLELGKNVQTINYNAFSNNELTKIDFPASVKTVGADAFAHNKLPEVTVPDTITNLGSGAFASNKITSFTLPEAMTVIPDRLFEDNSLKNIDAALAGVTEIGSSAFKNNLLNALNVPGSVKKIGSYAFAYNATMKDLILNEGLESIGNSAFYKTALDLEEFATPSTLKTIGDSAFNGSDSQFMRIKKLILNEGLTSIGSSSFNKLFMEDLELPTTLDTISDSAFSNNNLTQLPDLKNVKKIDNYAFYYNKLTKVVLPDTIKSIGNYAFKGGNRINSINFPEGLEHIGDYAFDENFLPSLKTPQSLKTIGQYAFRSNPLNTIELNEGLTRIGSGAFVYAKAEEIVLPDSLTEVESSVFRYARNLRKVKLGANTTKIYDNAFNETGLKTIEFPATLESIGNAAFKKTALKEVTLPDSVKIVEESAFADNKALNKVKLSENLKEISARTFENTALTTVDIPNNVATINNNAFRNSNISQLNVDLNNSKLNSIKDGAFDHNKLVKVDLPAKIGAIGEAFTNNTGYQPDPNRRVSVSLRAADGSLANPNKILDAAGHAINKVVLTILKRKANTNPEEDIALAEKIMVPANAPYKYKIEPSERWNPQETGPITIDVKDQDLVRTIYYEQKPGYNPDDVNIGLFHARNSNVDSTQPLSLKTYSRSSAMPLVATLSGSGSINVENAYLEIDFRDANGDTYVSGFQFPTGFENLVKSWTFEQGVLHMDLKKPVTAASDLTLPLNVKFKEATPNHYGLDLTSKMILGHKGTELRRTLPKDRLALRVESVTPEVKKWANGSDSTQVLRYPNGDDGTGYLNSENTPVVNYSFSHSTYRYASTYPVFTDVELIDTLPTYKGKDKDGQVKTLTAVFDPSQNPGWELFEENGVQKVKYKFKVAPSKPEEMPAQQLILSFPGAKADANIYVSNSVKGIYNGDSNNVINGDNVEAKAKFDKSDFKFDSEIPMTANSSTSVIFTSTISSSTPSKDNPSVHANPRLRTEKRSVGLRGEKYRSMDPLSNSSNVSSTIEFEYKGVHYKTTDGEHFNTPRGYFPYIYKSGGSSSYHYVGTFYDNAEDRAQEIEWGILIELNDANAKNLVIYDYDLDPRMKYTGIKLPPEFKTGTVTFYSGNNNDGEEVYTGPVYSDRYVVPAEVAEKAHSFKLALNGVIESKTIINHYKTNARVFTKLRNPDAPAFEDNASGDILASSDSKNNQIAQYANAIHNKVRLTGDLYTINNETVIEANSTDDREYILVLPSTPKMDDVRLKKTLDPNGVDGDFRDRNEMLHYHLRIITNKDPQTSMHDFKLVDVLPDYVEPVEVKFSQQFMGAVNPRYQFIENYENSNRWAVIIEADDFNPGGEAYQDLETLIADLDATTTTSLRGNDSGYVNTAYLSATGSPFWNQTGGKTDDIAFKAYDDKYTKFISDSVSFPVLIGAELKAYKYIKAQSDAVYSSFGTRVSGGEDFSYRLQLFNPGNRQVKELTFIDLLPYNGDLRTVQNSEKEYVPRGTLLKGQIEGGEVLEDRVKMNGPIRFEDGTADNYEVYYSTVDPVTLRKVDLVTIEKNADNWVAAADFGTDLSKVTMFKVKMKPQAVIEPNSELNFYLDMKAPENPDYVFDDQNFFNTFAFRFPKSPTYVEGNAVFGQMYSPRGTISLNKISNDKLNPGTKKPLSGAKFKVWMSEIKGVDDPDDIITVDGVRVLNEPLSYKINDHAISEFTTNLDGRIIFDQLKWNRDYIIEEIEAPAEHEIINKYTHVDKNELKNNKNNTVVIEIANRKVYKPVPFKPILANLKFYKVDAIGNPLAYTGFKLEGGPEGTNHVSRFVLASDSGLVEFKDIPVYGEKYPYTLTEQSPRGALQVIDPVTIHFTAQNKYKVDLGSVANAKAKLKVYKLGIYSLREQKKADTNIEKLTTTSGKRLADVKLVLYNEAKEEITELTTNELGEVQFADLEVNKPYYIGEPETPAGFTPYTNAQTDNLLKVMVTETGKLVVNDRPSGNNYAVLPNKPERNSNHIDIFKFDENRKPLEGATFELYEIKADGSEVLVDTQTSNKLGKLAFDGFAMHEVNGVMLSEVKTFEIREKTAPIGYVNKFKPVRFDTTEDNIAYLSLDVENPRIRLTVNKMEESTKKPIAGAKFKLFDDRSPQAEALETVISDATGVANFTYNQFDATKKYFLRETEPAPGYVMVSPARVEIIDLPGMSKRTGFNGKISYDWFNKKNKGTLKIFKRSKNGQPLRDVGFSLTKMPVDSNKALELQTDDQGMIIYNNLEIGAQYLVSETKPKAGYVLDPNAQNIKITVKDTEEIVLNFVNKPDETQLTLSKVNEQNQALAGVEFKLQPQDINSGLYLDKGSQTAKTDDKGNISFANLSQGNYRLTEVSAADAQIVSADGSLYRPDIVGVYGYKGPDKPYIVEVTVDPAAANGEPKIVVKEEGQTEELALPLVIVNKRQEPAKVKVVVNKTFTGGANLLDKPTFKVVLTRKTADGKDDPNFDQQTQTLVVDPNAQNSNKGPAMTAAFENLDYDYFNAQTGAYEKWQYVVTEVIEGLNADLFAPAKTSYVAASEGEPLLEGNQNVNVQSVQMVNNFQVPMTETATATKVWVNGGNDRPNIWFRLYRNIAGKDPEAVPTSEASIMLLSQGATTATWENLARTDSNGDVYIYSVKEVDAKGNDFTPANYVKAENGLTVTNTYSSPTNAAVTATMVWQGGPSPKPDIWFQLYRQIKGGAVEAVPTSEAPIQKLTDGTVQVTWANLTKTDANANPYIFSVKEVQANGDELVLDNYEKVANADPDDLLTVTNKYVISHDRVAKAVKVWKGGDAKHRPLIWFKLYRQIKGGNVVAVEGAEIKELAQDVVEVEWNQLDQTDFYGNPYIYSVREVNAMGQVQSPKNYRNREVGLEITNVYDPPLSPKEEEVIDCVSCNLYKDKLISEGETKDKMPKTGENTSATALYLLLIALTLSLAAGYRRHRRMQA